MRIISCILTALLCVPALSQRKPDPGTFKPAPKANQVEVRFARAEKAFLCNSFFLEMKDSDRTLLRGRFHSAFSIPSLSFAPSVDRTLNVYIKCAENEWKFSRVPSAALQQGWWWVGTDVPPFQPEFGEKFSKCKEIFYLIVDPTKRDGFDYFETFPPTTKGSKVACTGTGVMKDVSK
jgi:hypothetical protein